MKNNNETVNVSETIASTDFVEGTSPKKDNKRYYNYAVIIYEDDERFSEQYEALTSLKSAIWIRHDQDLWDKDILNEDGSIKYSVGTLKKPHYHFVIHLKVACTLSALSKKICVDEHLIEIVKKSFNGALRYLIHYGRDDKYQYSINDVSTNDDDLKYKFEALVSEEIPEVKRVMQIQELIENFNGYIDFGILGKQVQKLNIWDAFRRNLTYFIKIVDIHNAKHFGSKNGQKDLEYNVYSSTKDDFD